MYVFMWMCEVEKSISAVTLLLHKINAYQSTSSCVYDERGEETKVSNKCLQLIDKVSLGAPPDLLFPPWLFTYLDHVCSITGSTFLVVHFSSYHVCSFLLYAKVNDTIFLAGYLDSVEHIFMYFKTIDDDAFENTIIIAFFAYYAYYMKSSKISWLPVWKAQIPCEFRMPSSYKI